MRLESVRDLKQELRSEVRTAQVVARTRSAGARRATGVFAALVSPKLFSPIALGIQGKGQNWKLAVRVQEISAGVQQQIDDITQRAKGEVDVRLIGYVYKQARKRWHQKKTRPLRIGVSVGHMDVTAGTLGCFVARNGTSQVLILSNNHVLANEDQAKPEDPILQSGPTDGGTNPHDMVARLFRSIRFKKRSNRVDAAVAALTDGIAHDPTELKGLGKLSGVRTEPLDVGDEVFKVGRTTGLTRGRISAIEIDDVSVEYGTGIFDFDGQVEIESRDRTPFSLGGDSGSLIVDGNHRAVGLLFAGNDDDVTYANPIDAVLKTLNVQLLF